MLNIIKYHDYPYFIPSNNDGYQIRCGISKGKVYDCLLISEVAIQLLIDEFETLSQLDVVKHNERIDYELMLKFPILGHITSSKVTFNTIYQKLHQHLSILDGLQKSNEASKSKPSVAEINIKYVLDCFKQQDNMDVVQKFLKLQVILVMFYYS